MNTKNTKKYKKINKYKEFFFLQKLKKNNPKLQITPDNQKKIFTKKKKKESKQKKNNDYYSQESSQKKKKQPTPVDKENRKENKIRVETETELPIVDETRGSVY